MGWLSAAGSIVGGIFGANGAKSANEASLAAQKELYQNRYQWQVEDMRKAGLNPILAASGGGLSAPSVSAPQMQNTAEPLMRGIGMALNSAISLIDANAAKTTAEANRLNAETNAKNLSLQERIGDSVIKSNLAEAGYFDAQTGYYNILGPVTAAKGQAEVDKIRADIDILYKKLPYETDLLAANASAARASASLSLANIPLVSAQVGLTDAQRRSIEADLNDPKKLGSKEFWNKVFNSDEQHYKVIRESFYRGLENDILFNFGSSDKNTGTDLEQILTILSRVKYLGKK